MTEQRKRLLRRRLQQSRRRIHNLNCDFAEPLYSMLFVATENVRRISTNGRCIYFDPNWVGRLGDRELDFIISHQLMHLLLGHIDRPQFYSGDRFHLACDIIANSNLKLLGWLYGRLPKIGKIYQHTFYPVYEGRTLTCKKALSYVPFDPATLDPAVRRRYMIDSDEWWDKRTDVGECGVIVLSPADEDPEDIGDDIPDIGGERCYVTVEEIKKNQSRLEEKSRDLQPDAQPINVWDRDSQEEIQSLRSIISVGKQSDSSNDFVERLWRGVGSAQLNWRQLLNNFVQEDVYDYSFTPPDKRMHDADFFLPDYNEKIECPKKIFFAVDASESIIDDELIRVYSEICNAMAQLSGGFVGWIGFFSTVMHTPVPITDINDLNSLRPEGGGGTDFGCIFKYIKDNMSEELPASIVIFTDGMAEFPDEASALNIPVLWLLSSREVVAPWGSFAYVD